MYSVGTRIVHNNAVCGENGELLRVMTPQTQWAYAVEFPPQKGSSIAKTGGILKVNVRVHEGEIGLGLLTPDGGEYMCEAQVGASEESELVEIPLPKGAPGPLVLRNTSAAGNSKADIKFMGCDIPPVPAQPYWAGSRITHRRAVCKRDGDLLHITTPDEQWAQAVELLPQADASIAKTGGILKVNARVHEGEIGLGLWPPDGVGHVCEAQVGRSENSELVEIPLPKAAALHSLMIRNIFPGGKSRADVRFVGYDIAPEEPYWSALRLVHGQAGCKRAGDWLRITTPSKQWAYAVEFVPQAPGLILEKPMTLELRVRVLEGEIGLSLLAPIGRLEETRVAQSKGSRSMAILLPMGIALHSLMLRNVWPTGKSVADFKIVGWHPSTPAELMAASKDTPKQRRVELAPRNLLQHPAFRGIKREKYYTPGGYKTNGVGQRISLRFDRTWIPRPEWQEDRFESEDFPWHWLHEEIYEWIALAEAVREATQRMTMIELGAGYGRWLVSGAQLARKLNPDLKLKLVGVEADPIHFGWMREHFEDNTLIPAEHDLINAAVAPDTGTVYFCNSEDPSTDYGQHVFSGDYDSERLQPQEVEAIGINDLLRRYDQIDLIDIDIQGFERSIIPAGIDEINKRVRRIYVGTHEPAEIDTELKQLFAEAGWTRLASFPTKSKVNTEFGTIEFTDGCQYWLNPRVK